MAPRRNVEVLLDERMLHSQKNDYVTVELLKQNTKGIIFIRGNVKTEITMCLVVL